MDQPRDRVEYVVVEFTKDGSQTVHAATHQYGWWVLAKMSWDTLFARRKADGVKSSHGE